MRRVAVKTAAVALCLTAATTLGLGAPGAWADPHDQGRVSGVSQQADNPAVINPNATVQLSITKYLGEPTGQANDGRSLSSAPARPTLNGVDFDVYEVFTDSGRSTSVDLTTNTGWAQASALTGYRPTRADIAAKQFTYGGKTYYLSNSPTTAQTNPTGVATFTQGTGVGLYLVAENVKAGDTITNNAGGGTIPPNEITPSAPFLVTLPMTDPQNRDKWMYDVYVYPKNQRDTLTLKVVDKGVVSTEAGITYGTGPGAKHAYDYVLTSSITDGTEPLGSYVLYQDLDPSVTFTGASLSVGGTALTTGDYDIYTSTGWGQPATAYTGGTVSGGPLVTIVLTDAGRTKLEAARASDLVTTLNVVAGPRDGDGIVEGIATFVPNSGWWAQNGQSGVDANAPGTGLPGSRTGILSNEVLTQYGDLIVDKFDGNATTTKLAGAVFDIYSDPNSDGTCAPSEAVPANLIGTTPATDGTGAARFAGLQLSDFYNGGTGDARTYCLVERTAPTGYELDAAPRPFTVPANAATQNGVPTTTVQVANQKSNLGNKLPLTGGAGVALLSVLGALLIGGGVVYYVAARRREESGARP